MKRVAAFVAVVSPVLIAGSAGQAHSIPSRGTQLEQRQSATPDRQYATVVSPAPGQTVKLGGSSGLATKLIRLYVLAATNETSPPEQPKAAGDQRYGLEAYMTLPPNGFQAGSTQQEIDQKSFNAYMYPKLPLPRAQVTKAFDATLFLLESYTSPDDHGLDRVTRQAIPIRVVPA